jgi:hypothetical protein
MPKAAQTIFISYRRADAQGYAQNLHHRLAGWFDDRAELFFDAQHIDSGQDFPQRLVDGIDAAAAVLVLIGPGWLTEINHRAGLAEVDFVRQEVEQALRRQQRGDDVCVMPVLLGAAAMPSATDFAEPLKNGLAPLCRRDAHAFQSGKQDDWEHQFVRLRALLATVPNAPRERYRDRSGQPRPWRVIEHARAAKFQDPNQLLAALRQQLQHGGGTAAWVPVAPRRLHCTAWAALAKRSSRWPTVMPSEKPTPASGGCAQKPLPGRLYAALTQRKMALMVLFVLLAPPLARQALTTPRCSKTPRPRAPPPAWPCRTVWHPARRSSNGSVASRHPGC